MHPLNAILSFAALVTLSAAGADVVRGSDFGYDEADSTRFLQAAIDSGAKKVVIDARRWVTQPLVCRSGQELFFEDGAVVEAKKGAFLDRRKDQMFNVRSCTNVVIGGKGEIRMHHDDYLKPPYEKSEFRHCISVNNSANVRIWGLRILDSGGDGIYLGGKSSAPGVHDGGCHDITLQDLHIEGHMRQGMSVTFCDGLTVERCSFLNTHGTPPAAGIDFEPNGGYNRIRRIVLRDCVIGGNAGQGVSISIGHIWPETLPTYDITFERCRFDRDGVGGGGKKGRLVFRDCIFENPDVMPLGIYGGPFDPPDCTVEGCILRENGKDTPMDRAWLRRYATLLSGEEDVLSKPVAVDCGKLTVADPEPGKMRRFFGRLGVRLRISGRLVAYADSPRRIELRGDRPIAKRNGRWKGKRMTVTVSRFGGDTMFERDLPEDGIIAFDAPERGLYQIAFDLVRATLPIHAANCPVALDLTQCEHPLVQTSGTFAFWVPDGTERFEMFVGGSGRECVKATLTDPDGKAVWSEGCISAWCGHLQRGKAKPGLWRISLGRPERGPFEDYGVSLSGVPAFLFPDAERWWR